MISDLTKDILMVGFSMIIGSIWGFIWGRKSKQIMREMKNGL
jgi:hypothetical protein